MDSFTNQLQSHYKKFIFLCTASITIYYLIKKYFDDKKHRDISSSNKINRNQKLRKTIKDFPSIAQIQKFIEELPYDPVNNVKKSIKLTDLLGELSEFSEDDEWKELIASVQTICYDQNKPATNNTLIHENSKSTKGYPIKDHGDVADLINPDHTERNKS